MDSDKPVTVQNFLHYVRAGSYATNNLFFHRLLPGFVLQGGGFGTRETRSATKAFVSARPIPTFPTITNEFAVGPKVSNTYGTIAMAKLGGNPNSASAQWFFNLANNGANLDAQNGGFTVFGRVVRGTNVLEFFNGLGKQLPPPAWSFFGVVDLRAWYASSTDPASVQFGNLFSDLPVNYLGNSYPTYADLFYVDISLLNVRVTRLANGAREIRWGTVAGRPNVVEYTQSFPPSWQTLARPTGDGTEQSVTDTSAGATSRFYRVRVEY